MIASGRTSGNNVFIHKKVIIQGSRELVRSCKAGCVKVMLPFDVCFEDAL